MQYAQIPPPDFLRHHVRYFWTLESSATEALPKVFGPVVDGCPGLMFQQPDMGAFSQDNKQLADIAVYGQSTKHSVLTFTGQLHLVGIVFYPNALKSIFGINAGELTNACTNLELLPARHTAELSGRLLHASPIAEQINILSDYLFKQIASNQQADDLTQYAIAQIAKTKGGTSLKDLQDDLRMTERSFERRFKDHVGISPKLFSRICRFQASLSQLRANHYSKLSDVAFENDYADQSHFIRTFKEFTGFSPYQYQKQLEEVAENFTLFIN